MTITKQKTFTYCFKCDKLIRMEEISDYRTPLENACLWETTGNYGSTLIDNINPNSEKLEIWICDNCLTENKDKIWWQKDHSPWDPYGEVN